MKDLSSEKELGLNCKCVPSEETVVEPKGENIILDLSEKLIPVIITESSRPAKVGLIEVIFGGFEPFWLVVALV